MQLKKLRQLLNPKGFWFKIGILFVIIIIAVPSNKQSIHKYASSIYNTSIGQEVSEPLVTETVSKVNKRLFPQLNENNDDKTGQMSISSLKNIEFDDQVVTSELTSQKN